MKNFKKALNVGDNKCSWCGEEIPNNNKILKLEFFRPDNLIGFDVFDTYDCLTKYTIEEL